MAIEQELRNELLRTFVQLVTISSPTGHVAEFQQHLMKCLTENGLTGGMDKFGNMHYRTQKFNRKNSLLLTTHVDTVSPGENIKPALNGDWIKSSGSTILGADPKAGITAALVMLDYFRKRKQEVRDVEFIFSNNEEEGDHTLNYAKPVSKNAIVLDNGAPIEEVEYWWPFAKVFLIEVHGKKEIHAQHFYNKGANAIVSLSEIIASVPWGYFKKGCVANTGTVSGGRSTTLVPDYACLKGNVYCFESSDVEAFIDKAKKIIAVVDKKYKTKTSFKILETYRGAKADLNCDFIKDLRDVYAKHGVSVNFLERLLINCNNCLPAGVQSVNAGLGHTNIHTVDEKLSISGLTKFTRILIDYIEAHHVS